MILPLIAPPAPAVQNAPLRVSNVRKISQITGEVDRERNVFADNRTESRYGLAGTDLGASFEHNGKLVFLFGDTWPIEGKFTADRPFDGDSTAISDDTNPDDGLTLDFVRARDGKYATAKMPGVNLGTFEVPNGGFSNGRSMYGIYTTDHASSGGYGMNMNRSVLGRSTDGIHWTKVYDLSREKFINVSPVIVDAAKTPGLPMKRGKAVLMWASGRLYRRSDAHLAVVPLDQVENAKAIRYWTPTGWSEKESDAAPVVRHPEIGELSVAYCAPLKKWLMLYNSGNPRGITMRTADAALGPWSGPQTLFNPENGYGRFMHISWSQGYFDRVHDLGREFEYGGEYGPYMIPRFFKSHDGGARIYFVMSIWNPYQVVLMRADLK